MSCPDTRTIDDCPPVPAEARASRPSSRESTVPPGTKWLLAGFLAAACLALDLLTKRLVQATDFRAIDVLPFLSIQRQVNRGVAFGLLWERYGLIIAAAGIALVVILVYLRMETRPILGGVAGGFLLGGSLGNLWERVAHGEVTDFIKVPHYPTFNLADVFIFIGVALVAISLLWRRPREDGHA